MYGLWSLIHFCGNGIFNGANVGSAIDIRLTNISFNGAFKFYNNQQIESSGPGPFSVYSGGAISALRSVLTMQGLFYFDNNLNIYGGAISLRSTNCSIVGLLKLAGNRALLDGGAIYARSSSLAIQSDESAGRFDSFNSECLSKSYPQSIIFCNNSAEKLGGAIHLEDSNMTLTGSVIFVANKAQSGGGISIYYSSDPRLSNPNSLVFQEPLDITFHANVAYRFGGAMYINDRYLDTRLCEHLFPDTNKCFFAVNISLQSNVKLNFTNNQALAGAGIYGGAMQYCLVELRNKTQLGYEVLQNLSSTEIQNLRDNFDALKIRHCINGTTPDLYNRSVHIIVQRGQMFNISVTVLGEFDFPVSERVAFTLTSNQERSFSQIFVEPYNYLIRKGCRNLGFGILSEHQKEELMLRSPKCSVGNSLLRMNVQLKDCPPGFVLIKNAKKLSSK